MMDKQPSDGSIPFHEFAEEARRIVSPPELLLPTFNVSDFDGRPLPVREWHVDGFLPNRNVTLLTADGGDGKSTIAVQLCSSTCLGRPWLGMPCASGAVVFLSAEDDLDELHRRFEAAAIAEGVSYRDLPGITIVPLAGRDAVLAALDGRDGLLKPTANFVALKKLIQRLRPILLVLDTLADVFGGDEIKKAHARQFITLMRGLAVDFGLTILLIGHPSQSGMASGAGTSGNTAWSNSVRSRLYLDRVTASEGIESDPDLRVLTVKKSNYSRAGEIVRLRWRHGVFVADEPETARSKSGSMARAEQTFLDLLTRFEEEGRTVSTTPSANYAPTMFAVHPKSDGITKRAFAVAMDNLLGSKRVAVDWTGPPSKRRSRLVVSIAEKGSDDEYF